MYKTKLIIYYLIFILLFSFISCKRKDFHPFRIQYDFSNLRKGLTGESKKILIEEMEMAAEFISNLIYNNNNIRNSISFTQDNLKYCYDKSMPFEIKKYTYENTDLLIIPLYGEKDKKNFQGYICKQYNLKVAYLSILDISANYVFKLIKSNNVYLLRLKILHALTNILGFDTSLLNKERLSNSYFVVPKYVTDNFWYSQSIKKYYNFTRTEMPKIVVSDEVRRSYKKYWTEEVGIPDYMRDKIKTDYMITELTTYLLKDLPFYRINKCDFELFNNKICYRFDKKCFKFEDLYYNYFIDYHYEKDKNGKLIVKCHLNTDINLKNKQCGVIEGDLINKLISDKYSINYEINNKKKLNNENNKYKVPEFDDLEYQKIQLVSPSERCPKKHPRTVFFSPLYLSPEAGNENINRQLLLSLKEHVEKEKSKFKIEEVTLTDKKYFLSFLSYTNYQLIVDTLKGNGFVRSFLQNGNHNMLAVPPYKFNIEDVNKYQFFYKREGQVGISNKHNLHRNYDKMRKLFPEDYNYMSETYTYPEMKEIIIKKFKDYQQSKGNLWLIKPKSSSEGRGIHMFESLENEKGSFLITKYIENPHLIYGKKYDFRIYVLITSANPLSIYIYDQGLVRIASEKYSLDINRLNSRFIHLTNTVVNKANKDYIFNDSIDSEIGNKWSLKTYKKYCEKMVIDFDTIFANIKDVVIKTILSNYNRFLNDEDVKKNHKNFYHRNYHNLFGFDIILDDDLKAFLLEVNDGPSLSLYDNMDRDIKTKLMADTFNLIGIVPFAHDETQKPMDEIYEYTDRSEEEIDYALCEFSRPKGNYERIFPVKNNIERYKKLFLDNLTKENQLLWEKIENMDDFN